MVLYGLDQRHSFFGFPEVVIYSNPVLTKSFIERGSHTGLCVVFGYNKVKMNDTRVGTRSPELSMLLFLVSRLLFIKVTLRHEIIYVLLTRFPYVDRPLLPPSSSPLPPSFFQKHSVTGVRS